MTKGALVPEIILTEVLAPEFDAIVRAYAGHSASQSAAIVAASSAAKTEHSMDVATFEMRLKSLLERLPLENYFLLREIGA